MSPAPDLSQLVNSSLDLKWHMDPVAATEAGVPGYDHRLGRFGADDMKHHLAALRSLSAALEECTAADVQDEIDVTALLNGTRADIHRIDVQQPHVRNPTFWAAHALEGLYLLLVRRDSDRAHRASAAAARLAAMPSFFETARAGLADCPRVFVETAVSVARAGASLVDDVERELRPDDVEDYDTVCREAKDALDSFANSLEADFLDAPPADFACGEQTFNFKLAYEHALRATAAELWRYGHALVEEVEHGLSALAAEIDPGVSWPDLVDRLRDEHPGAEDLVGAYATAMDGAREFVAAHDLVPIPEGTLTVVETPAYLRTLIPFAAYQPPGAFSEDRSGWFYVTPPGQNAPADARERILRDHPVHDLPCTALHEGYPGHHLHFLHAQAQPRVVRKVVGTPVTIEGWALYCEEMMGEAGFYRSLEERFFQQLALLWRAVRIVADVGLHTRGMSFDQGVALLVDRLHFDHGNAEAEVRRYCADPAYQIGYAVGRREIRSLHQAYREAAGPDYSLKRFHEELLAYGLLPVSLMRWGMGLDG